MIDINDYDIQCIEHEILWKYDKSPCDYPDCDCLLSLRKDMINERVLANQEEILPDIIAFNDAMTDALRELYDRDQSKSRRRHYKHTQRWQLANTLTSLYGYDKALELMYEICDGTSERELRGDVKTASIHQKPISIWAVKELNKWHGFKIKLAGAEDPNAAATKSEAEKKTQTDSPTNVLNSRNDFIQLHIKSNQYLGDIKEDIISNLSNITLLEAGAGYGKLN